MKQFYTQQETRLAARKVVRSPQDRYACNNLLATQGAPGTGKSFLADEVAAFRDEDIQKFSSSEMESFWRDIVSVTVTYNGPSPYRSSIDNDTDVGLALRMLWR